MACASTRSARSLVQPVIQQKRSPDSSARTFCSTHCSRQALASASRIPWRSCSAASAAPRVASSAASAASRSVMYASLRAMSVTQPRRHVERLALERRRLLRELLQFLGGADGQRVQLAFLDEPAQQHPRRNRGVRVGRKHEQPHADERTRRGGARQVDRALGQRAEHAAPAGERRALRRGRLHLPDQRLGVVRPRAHAARRSGRAWPPAVREMPTARSGRAGQYA